MNDPAMGAGIWLDTVLHRLRHAAGNRAAQLSDAAAMTDEERQRFSRRLRERDAEIERLRAALQSIAELDVHHKDDNGTWTDVGKIARRALEPKP